MNVRQYTAFISSNNDKPNYGIIYGDMSKDDFSENLFWDADPDDLDLARNRRYVVQRVLERGTVADIGRIIHMYGMPDVVATAKSLRALEPKALSFIACVANEPRENFRCYTSKQSSQAPWIF